MLWYGHKTGRTFWQVTDFIAPLVPTGLGAGRLGNFINGELPGRLADPTLPWAMVYPNAGPLPPGTTFDGSLATRAVLPAVVLPTLKAAPVPPEVVES